MRVCNEAIFLSLARRVLVVLARDIKADYPIAKYRRFEVKKEKKKKSIHIRWQHWKVLLARQKKKKKKAEK